MQGRGGIRNGPEGWENKAIIWGPNLAPFLPDSGLHFSTQKITLIEIGPQKGHHAIGNAELGLHWEKEWPVDRGELDQ
jgi:hypothetical protein